MARSTQVRLGVALAVALIALGGCTRGSGGPDSVFDKGDNGDKGGKPAAERVDHVATVPVNNRESAEFDLVSSVTTVTVRSVDLGDTMVRATTPDDSAIAPSIVDSGGPVQLHLADTGLAGPKAVLVELNSGVRWQLKMVGGSTRQTIDFGAGLLDAVDFAAGVTTIDVVLPVPEGTMLIRMAGGASEFSLHAPKGPPARVTIGGGAANVTVDGVTHSGIVAGTVFTPPDWATATDRYDIAATAGVSTLTVDRR